MDFGSIGKIVADSKGDPGAYLKGELEEGLEPITARITALEKKIELLLLAVERVEKLLKAIQPVVELIKKIPFVK